MDNILLAQELMANLDRRLKNSNLILKLDMKRPMIVWNGLSYCLCCVSSFF